MRKIINGRLYDTEKAKEIATYYYNSGDFARYNEKLYKTKKGRWFMVGEGGPLSKYHENIGNSTYGTTELFLLDNIEARIWLSEHNEIDIFEREFGKLEEG